MKSPNSLGKFTQSFGGLLAEFLDTDSKIDAIVHCCNCQGEMGSGIAKQIRDRIPAAFGVYESAMKRSSPRELLGTISSVFIFLPKFTHRAVINLHAQETYGIHRRCVDYEALYKSLIAARALMREYQLTTLGVPYRMGCDRAGGSWIIVRAMLEEVFVNTGLNVHIVRR